MNMNYYILINNLKLWDDDAWAEIAQLASRDLESFVCIFWKAIACGGRHDDGGVCSELMRLWVNSAGSAAVQNAVLRAWPTLSEDARCNITFAIHDENSMPTDLAIRIFELPDNTVRIRHLVAAGLAVTARQRRLEFVLDRLLDKIGTYEDFDKQLTLDQFVLSAKKHLEEIRSFTQ